MGNAFEEYPRRKMDWRPVLYVSGPMEGKPEHNYPLFCLVTAALRSAGWTVINPAENFGGARDRLRHEYLAKDVIALVMYARGIVLLPEWEDSDGARLEAQIAVNQGYDLFAWQPGAAKVYRDVNGNSIQDGGGLVLADRQRVLRVLTGAPAIAAT